MMNVLLGVALGLIALVVFLISTIQQVYFESQRLRTRDVPMQQFFRNTLEERIGFSIEKGSLAFSLAKHGALLIGGILALAFAVDGGTVTGWLILQAAVGAWLFMMLFAYIIPQILYRRSSGEWLVPLVPLLRFCAQVMMPVVGLLTLLHSLVDITGEAPAETEPPTPAENIDALITAGAEEGLIEEEDRELIQNVVEFGDKVVREVMTPRPNIVAIRADATLEQLRQLVICEQYSRIPVFDGSIDQIVGFVHVRDMFELEEEERSRGAIRDLMRPIRFVPETKSVHDLMREMQQEGAHMVIVVDEYGNTAGLATLEDIVEVILGEIRDEHEPDSDVTRDERGAYIVSGSFDVGRLADMLGIKLEDDIESTTVGGLVSEWLGRVPGKGESVERDGVRIEILAADELRVEQVRVSKTQAVTP
jgi:CBS domain containing-hemolysin-like protein